MWGTPIGIWVQIKASDLQRILVHDDEAAPEDLLKVLSSVNSLYIKQNNKNI